MEIRLPPNDMLGGLLVWWSWGTGLLLQGQGLAAPTCSDWDVPATTCTAGAERPAAPTEGIFLGWEGTSAAAPLASPSRRLTGGTGAANHLQGTWSSFPARGADPLAANGWGTRLPSSTAAGPGPRLDQLALAGLTWFATVAPSAGGAIVSVGENAPLAVGQPALAGLQRGDFPDILQSVAGLPALFRGSHVDSSTGIAGPEVCGVYDLDVFAIDKIEVVAVVGGVAGFTFATESRNPAGEEPIPWLFTVKETATTPWVIRNRRFSWNHAHPTHLPPPSCPTGNHDDSFGRHPHMQLHIFRHLPDGNAEIIGSSDLKHGFKTDDDSLPHGHHFLHPGESDPYGAHINRNRDFYSSPVLGIDGIDPNTFVVATHDHLGFRNADGVYERDHGEPEHVGPLNIEHLLKAPVDALDPARNPPGTFWMVAASYFVVGDRNLDNNTIYAKFDPGDRGINPAIGCCFPGPFIPPRNP